MKESPVPNPRRPDSENEDEEVFEPDELDYTDSENIEEIDARRYVVTGDSEPIEVDDDMVATTSGSEHQDETDPLADVDSAFAIDLDVKAQQNRDSLTVESNDVTEVFEELVRAYVRQFDTDLNTAETMQLLINESEIPVTTTTEDLGK